MTGLVAQSTVLYVAFRANDPLAPPSRHVVTDVDVVHFARGRHRFVRERRDSLSRLSITIPDPLMSADHGQLVRARDTWMLDDPASKNGAVVRGERTRAARLEAGDAFALGHTIFLLAREGDGGALDRTLDGQGLDEPPSPLRERRPELGLLIRAVLLRSARARDISLTPAAAVQLFEYTWPGDVNELESALTTSTALADEQPIGLEHLPEAVRTSRRAPP